MKIYSLLIALLISSSSLAQCINCYAVISTNQYKSAVNTTTINFTNSQYDRLNNFISQLDKDAPNIDGSVFLFDDWNNKAIVETSQSTFTVPNINYNIEQDAFMTKMEDGMTLLYDFKKVKKIQIKDKVYRRIESLINESNKIYEVIYRGKSFAFLKGFDVKLVEASPDPKLNRLRPKIMHRNTYYIYTNGDLKKVKLKKKDLLALIESEDKKEFLRYVANNKLSYKRETDVQKMLAFNNK